MQPAHSTTRRGALSEFFVIASLVLSGMTSLPAMAAELAASDKSFLLDAAESGNTEIVASKSAQGKASTTQVKNFAGAMITDHQKVADELQTLAAQKGVKVPDEPSKAQQARISKLNGMSGRQFDHEYANEIGVAAHKDAVALFRKSAQGAKDPDVKAFAARTLPALEHHLQMAQDLKAALDKM